MHCLVLYFWNELRTINEYFHKLFEIRDQYSFNCMMANLKVTVHYVFSIQKYTFLFITKFSLYKTVQVILRMILDEQLCLLL